MIVKRTSRDWNDVRNRCEEWISNETSKLENATSFEEVKFSQGKIAAWRSILMMEDVSDAQD
jgi:hypothetical protein